MAATMVFWLQLLFTLLISAQLPYYCWARSMHGVPHRMGGRSHIKSRSLRHTGSDDSIDHGCYYASKRSGTIDHGFRSKFSFDYAACGKSTSDIVGSRRRRSAAAVGVDTITSKEEVEVLTAFKAAITSDRLGALGSWNATDSDACGWERVKCTANSTHVVALNLSGLQLVGTLSDLPFDKLLFLQQLDLSDNFLDGSLPLSLGNCSNLVYLNASVNQLSGDIPPQIGELLNLQILDLSNNSLTGVIPGRLGNCSSLRHLNLDWNSIEANIPPQLGHLAHLQLLNLAGNSLSGSIPPALGNCSSLIYLRLALNADLGGELPVELNGLKRLQHMQLARCSFAGVLPVWIVNFTSLMTLNFAYNQFIGEIPRAIGQISPGLTELSLTQNKLTGVVPWISIVNMTDLTYLGLQTNSFTGKIPPEIGLMSSLEQLRLFSNNFTGIIPSSLSNCSRLTHFLLGYNPFDPQTIPSWIASAVNMTLIYLPQMNLQGEIPAALGQLSKLDELLVPLNNLTGRVPASLGNCSSLTNINIRSNLLRGEIPREIGLLSKLYFLQFALNSFTGSFPSLIFNLTAIEYFDIQGNNFSGNINGDFGRLGKMGMFQVNDNEFYGSIPEALTNCSNLNLLGMSWNSLSGTIPPSLGNLTKLESLWLDKNQFHGKIPLDLLRGPVGILELRLEDNKLEGVIPAEIGQAFTLTKLFLYKNNFSGSLPSSLGNCTKMLHMDLSNNRFSGAVPGDAISKMSASLIYLDLSYNLFSGAFPSQLSQLANIQVINMSANDISGSIPPGLDGCKALSFLDLSLNNFSGAIPLDLGLIESLQFFNASYNNFEGQIPESGVFKENLTAASFLGNPDLCGSILGPGQQCPVLEASPPGTPKLCEGFKCKRVWIPVVCILIIGIVLIFGVSSYWLLYHGKPKSWHHNVTLNFDSRIRLEERDILATVDAGEENVIGIGAKSIVYKGVLQDGHTFALKLLRDSSEHPDRDDGDGKQSEMKLIKEVTTLAGLRHRNIIKILGFYSALDLKAIVFEYMSEGSLHKHLHENGACELSWEMRFKILIGVAHGLVYLHHDFPDPIIHRDLKPSNILLDADMEPKLCDFGISKFVNPEKDGEATASTFCGTIGYIPPEYGTEARVSTKGDVYSYGVVVLEMLSGRPVTIANDDGLAEAGDNGGLLSTDSTQTFQDIDNPFQLSLDSTLINGGTATTSTTKEQILFLVKVGLLCTRTAPQTRPSMRDVLGMLLQIKDMGIDPVTHMTLQDPANVVQSNNEENSLTMKSEGEREYGRTNEHPEIQNT